MTRFARLLRGFCRSIPGRGALGVVLGLGISLSPAVASANGAFPDAQSLILGPASDETILLATNFGLVRSDDGGVRWTWTCELGPSMGGTLYGATFPSGRLFTVGAHGVATSNDGACSWQSPSPASTTARAPDYFLDPRDAMRVWLLGPAGADSPGANALFVSHDGGTTFSATGAVAASDEVFGGVESSVQDPAWVTLVAQPGPPGVPRLGVSHDAGGTFAWSSLEALGPTKSVRIIALDPENPAKVYLRISKTNDLGGTDEALAVVTGADGGGGASPLVTVPIAVGNGTLSAFLRRSSGVVLVAGAEPTGPLAWRSTDGGASFETWNVAGLHIRGLAEKAGLLYVVADALKSGDPFVIGTSADEGGTWRPLLSAFNRVSGLPSCAAEACQSSCASYVALGVFSASVCSSTAVETPDAGPPVSAPSSGCSCAMSAVPRPTGIVLGVIALAGAAALARRRSRGARPPEQGRATALGGRDVVSARRAAGR